VYRLGRVERSVSKPTDTSSGAIFRMLSRSGWCPWPCGYVLSTPPSSPRKLQLVQACRSAAVTARQVLVVVGGNLSVAVEFGVLPQYSSAMDEHRARCCEACPQNEASFSAFSWQQHFKRCCLLEGVCGLAKTPHISRRSRMRQVVFRFRPNPIGFLFRGCTACHASDLPPVHSRQSGTTPLTPLGCTRVCWCVGRYLAIRIIAVYADLPHPPTLFRACGWGEDRTIWDADVFSPRGGTMKPNLAR